MSTAKIKCSWRTGHKLLTKAKNFPISYLSGLLKNTIILKTRVIFYDIKVEKIPISIIWKKIDLDYFTITLIINFNSLIFALFYQFIATLHIRLKMKKKIHIILNICTYYVFTTTGCTANTFLNTSKNLHFQPWDQTVWLP